MPRITKVYTRTGDDGTTALGSGQRVSKADPRIDAYGTVDELNAQLGVVLACGPAAELVEPLRRIQNELFHAGAELCVRADACPPPPTQHPGRQAAGPESSGKQASGPQPAGTRAEAPQPPGPRIHHEHVEQLERLMDTLSKSLEPLANFVLPGGTPAAAQLHVARTVCRRAERLVVALAAHEPVGGDLVRYLNRLSDLLFVMGRFENRQRGQAEPVWNSRA